MPPKKKNANGYKFASPLPKGIILEDLAKKKWKLGVSIGRGGFGEIYSAQEAETKGNKYPYVVKIEPHENGPLFVEINFYIRNAKIADVENFKKENGLKTFGMPVYCGSGSHEYDGEKYRFLVMKKFGSDLLNLYNQNNKQFPIDTVFKIGLQVIDVLKYMHNRGYVHADIKAANLLLGESKEDQNKQVYLVDFGLASKYSLDKEFKPNPKKAHDGTIEYLSRDAHLGVQTRRGDLEILAYNMLHWLGCKLPWEKKIKDPKLVQNSKEESMSSVSNMIKVCFGSTSYPKAIEDYLDYLSTLKFNTEPDYGKIKSIFMSGLKSAGGTLQSSLEFTKLSKTPSKRTRTPTSAGKSSNRNKIKNNDDEATTPKAVSSRSRKPKRSLTKSIENTDDDESNEEVIPKAKSRKINTKFEKVNINSSSPSEVDMDDDGSRSRKPKRALTKSIENTDEDDESNEETIPKAKSRKINTKSEKVDINSSSSSEIDMHDDDFSPVAPAPIPKRRLQANNKKKKTDITNNTSNAESPVRKPRGGISKNVTVRKNKQENLSSISEQDTDNETSPKTLQAVSNYNNLQSQSGSEKIKMKKQRKNPTTSAKLKKGQAMSLDDLSGGGYTEAMKEVLMKKIKRENKKGKSGN